ncbi:hypothetical protein D4764_04G0013670 [Takifugu flavidus]|uniref:Uncharacterized protein n=1 Tax=Takifugu flavidus TaxID=433684 RepID=A0A5C6NA29_9TELE|nr:hypothetical protein D4764_04G0013670 [Takifugu flavidus]
MAAQQACSSSRPNPRQGGEERRGEERRGEERRGEERRGEERRGEERRGEETMTQWGDRGLSGEGVSALSPSILYCLSGVESRVQQPKKRNSDFPLPSYFFQLIRRDPKAFPDRSRDIVSLTCPGSSRDLLPEGHALKTSPGRCP